MKHKKGQWSIRKDNPHTLGTRISSQGVHFAVEAGRNQQVDLVLYSKKEQKEHVINLDHIPRTGNVLAFCVEKLDYEQYDYNYRVDGQEILDPWAYSIVSPKKRTFGTWDVKSGKGLRSGFYKEESFDWEETSCPEIPLSDTVLYSMHVRGFTRHSSSGVKAKGTFQGIIEKIPYLKELGVTQIELMPVYEFKEIIEPEEMNYPQYREDETTVSVNYWGYSDENYYMAVKDTYCSCNGAVELKKLVRELHRNGMELVLEFYLTKEQRISAVVQCLKYWASEYRIDGFHITGNWSGVEELLKEPVLAQKKIYSGFLMVEQENRDCGVCREEVRRAAIYNIDYMTNMRSFLKSDSGKVLDAAYYMRRNGNDVGFVNYFAGHDGFTMHDMVSYEQKHNEANGEGNQDGWDYNYSWNCGAEGKTKKKKVLDIRCKQLKNAWTMLLLSQGIPAILAGDEICNSQNGNNNVYCQDNETGWINWKLPKSYEGLHGFVKQMIRFRKEHPVFHLPSEPKMSDTEGIGYPDLSYHSNEVWYMDEHRFQHAIGMLYCGDYAKKADGQADDYFYVACNMGWSREKFAIPNLPKDRTWYKMIDTDCAESFLSKPETVEEQVMDVPPRTIVILIGKKHQVKQNDGKKSK